MRSHKTRHNLWVGVILVAMLACVQSTRGTDVPPPAPGNPSPSPTTQVIASPTPIPEHRIAIRTIDGVAEFYDRETGERFVPRGPNFHIFRPESTYVVDALFSPAHYDPAHIDEAFAAMRSLGYNSVRTSVDLCANDCIGDPAGGLRDEWLANIADFLQRAKAHGLVVILTSNDLPKKGGYVPRAEADCCEPFDGYINTHYLSPVGVELYKEYWQAIIRGLIANDAPLDTIMAYSVRGEQFLWTHTPPVSLEEGTVTTANGQSYDMSDPAQKQAMMDDGLAYWIDELRAGVRELDPTALVTVGMFAPNTPNDWRPEDRRYVPTIPALARSQIDFFDVHLYPGQAKLSALAENFGLPYEERPVMLAEFGAFQYVFRSPATGAAGNQDWQVESCDYGIDGWMHWHWEGVDDHEVWTGSEFGEAINLMFAPTNRPDPCEGRDFDFFENNLAANASLRVSSVAADNDPQEAIDGWIHTAWRSGGEPVQWIELDLGAPATIERIRLIVDQFPAGATVHQILGRGPGEDLRVLHEFREGTKINDILEFVPPEPITGIQVVRIMTTSSPSFVSWFEVEVIGEMEE
ncbi:MAG: hypothetical protein DWQ07_06405 [Chloroflexi bacterium]|nr:MAG: hypothetical protein DWQ07_06405 [Chloroflexota bacterium]MBL1195939.1 hypothetical protein [Chloroflexota bacterium]NOH13232.1 hypothetical protein [Chloroflexota bacterium]